MRVRRVLTERDSHRALIVVCVLHAASGLVLLGLHWWFGIDETVYLSQLNRHVPAGVFSAPRARGSTLLAAPVTLLTSSVAAVRIWVATLSGLGMYLGFRPWLKLTSAPVVPVAALIFASIWSVMYYDAEVMPNLWVAYCALAAAAGCVHCLRGTRAHTVVGTALALAILALFRPSDALYASAPMIVLALAAWRTPWRRRLITVAVVVVGVTLGWLEWIIEAFVRYGGFSARVAAAQAEQGPGGLTFSLLPQERVLTGPLLCRHGCVGATRVEYAWWWPALAVLVLLGLVGSWKRRQPTVAVVCVLVAAGLAAQYLFTVPYGAPRFLIPAYALLSIPAAQGVMVLVERSARAGARRAVAATLVAVFAVHTALQVNVIVAYVRPAASIDEHAWLASGFELTKLGMRQPCLVLNSPTYSQDVAYAAGCTNAHGDAAAIEQTIRRGTGVVRLSTVGGAHRYGVTWRLIELPIGPRGRLAPAFLYLPARP